MASSQKPTSKRKGTKKPAVKTAEPSQSQAPSQKTTPTASNKSDSQYLQVPASEPDKTQSIPSQPKNTRHSASAFAANKDDLNDSTQPGMQHYYWERNSLRAACQEVSLMNAKNDLNVNGYGQINDMVSIYKDVVEFAFPSDGLEGVLDNGSTYKSVLDTLLAQYDAYSASLRAVNPDAKIPPLKEEISLRLKNRLAVFLYAVTNAHNRVNQTLQGVASNEAEMREAPDVIMQLFWGCGNTNISDCFFKEAQIHLPKNKFVDGAFGDRDQSELWFQIATRQIANLSEEPESDELTDIEDLMVQRATDAGKKQGTAYVSPYAKKGQNAMDPKAADFKPEASPAAATPVPDVKSKADSDAPAPIKAEPCQATADGLGTIRYFLEVDSGVVDSESKSVDLSNVKNSASTTPGILPSIFVNPKVSYPGKKTADCPGIKLAAKNEQSKVSKQTRTMAPPKIILPGGAEVSDQYSGSAHKDCKVCLFTTNHLQIERGKVGGIKNMAIPYGLLEIGLPSIFLEFKRWNHVDATVAFNQCQMDLISGLEYLGALGITDIPIFGVVVTGSRAVIMMAWKSTLFHVESPSHEKLSINIVLDQNLTSFDLSEPLEAYHFAIAIHAIYQGMQDRFEKVLAGPAGAQLRTTIQGVDATKFTDSWATPIPPRIRNSKTA